MNDFLKHTGPRWAPEGAGGGGSDGGGPPVRRRQGSVTFQREGAAGADESSMLDPANQSLADALNVMMMILQGAMLILAGAYVFSGLHQVKEGERGIRLLFGAKQAANLEPGAAWSAPYPLGEVIKVPQGELSLNLDRDFWQFVDAGGDPSPEKLPPKPSLKPFEGGSGSVLTSDGNVAHTRWRVAYSRSDAAKNAENMLNPTQEENLVRYAVRRGIVHACASVGIEELLKQSGNQPGSVADKARKVAQQTLDTVKSGITIDQLDPLDTIPPTNVKADFAKVQSSTSDARKAVENARADANRTLLEAAGQAGPYLVRHLDLYEEAAARRNAASAAGQKAEYDRAQADMVRLLSEIDALMLGQKVEVPAGEISFAGETKHLEGGAIEGLAGGKVAEALAGARSYRTGVVNRSRSDLRRFEARLRQFEANPGVTIYREWSESVAAFLGRDSVQMFLLPPGMGTLNLQLNRDPDVVRDQQKLQRMRDRDDAERKRLEEFDKAKYKTDTGLQPLRG